MGLRFKTLHSFSFRLKFEYHIQIGVDIDAATTSKCHDKNVNSSQSFISKIVHINQNLVVAHRISYFRAAADCYFLLHHGHLKILGFD